MFLEGDTVEIYAEKTVSVEATTKVEDDVSDLSLRFLLLTPTLHLRSSSAPCQVTGDVGTKDLTHHVSVVSSHGDDDIIQ